MNRNYGHYGSPAGRNMYKRFSLSKKEEKRSFVDYMFDWIIKGVLVGLLISINFLLFASSSDYSLFEQGFMVVPQILMPIVGIFALSLGLMFLISFSSLLENILTSFVVALFCYAILNQFLLLSPESFLYSMFYSFSPSFASMFLGCSNIIVAIVAAIVAFFLLVGLEKKYIFFITMGLVVAFLIIIGDEYINRRHKSAFVTVYEKETSEVAKQGSKFIYIMIPNATSYSNLTDLRDDGIVVDSVDKTKDIMLGFYARNNFTLYANAHVEETDPYLNIVEQFNILSNRNPKEDVLDNIAIDSYLQFKNKNDKHVHLEENNLFDNFKNANFKIKVYQTHGIELCKKNNEVVADKCVEKQNRPFSFTAVDFTESQKTKLLVLQWINSTGLFNNLSTTYSFLNSFTNANKIALVGIPYDNLNVINSIETLDVMFDDITRDSGDVTYFALLDLPGDMFVYDELCKIRPADEWLAKDNLSWIQNPNLAARKKAYMEQTNCLYGKLQEFIDKLHNSGLDKNSVVVVQGISGYDNHPFNHATDDIMTYFRSSKAVITAIKEPKRKEFDINYNFCTGSSFLMSYLYSKNICKTTKELDISKAAQTKFLSDFARYNISKDSVSKAQSNFSKWYDGFKLGQKIDFSSSESSVATPSKAVPIVVKKEVIIENVEEFDFEYDIVDEDNWYEDEEDYNNVEDESVEVIDLQ